MDMCRSHVFEGSEFISPSSLRTNRNFHSCRLSGRISILQRTSSIVQRQNRSDCYPRAKIHFRKAFRGGEQTRLAYFLEGLLGERARQSSEAPSRDEKQTNKSTSQLYVMSLMKKQSTLFPEDSVKVVAELDLKEAQRLADQLKAAVKLNASGLKLQEA